MSTVKTTRTMHPSSTRYTSTRLLQLFAAAVASTTIITKAAAIPTSTLIPGDIHIVAYATDEPDAFAFVTWVDILAGTEIFFTDKGWDCNGLTSGETVIKYTAPIDLVPGTVVSWLEGDSTNIDKGFDPDSQSAIFSATADQLIVFQGTVENPTPIYAFDTTGGWEDCNDINADNYWQSALPTGLVDGVSAISFDHSDNYWYRPVYARSATLTTLKQWMVNPARFWDGNTNRADYEVPESFRILEGEMGATGYTEYIKGTAPCVIISGHDGDLFPDDIEDRTNGCLVDGSCLWEKNCGLQPGQQEHSSCTAGLTGDFFTQDMARRAVEKFEEFTGSRCHLVVNRLYRTKLDVNREVKQAAQFDPTAIDAYNEFHYFVGLARNEITNSNCGKGIVFDFHGHAHPENRIEIGYKLLASDLRKSDAEIDGLASTSSIKSMPTWNTVDPNYKFSDIIRGQYSLGELFERGTAMTISGWESVPSPTVPFPLDGELYFQGGYNTDLYGSQYGGTIDAVQLEFPRSLRFDNWVGLEDFLTAFGYEILPEYLQRQYFFTHPGECPANTQSDDLRLQLAAVSAELEQTLSELEQTTTERDQTLSELEQTTTELVQTRTELDAWIGWAALRPQSSS